MYYSINGTTSSRIFSIDALAKFRKSCLCLEGELQSKKKIIGSMKIKGEGAYYLCKKTHIAVHKNSWYLTDTTRINLITMV